MCAFSHGCESNLLFKAIYIKLMSIILVLISPISLYKAIKSSGEFILTGIISEIEPSDIFYKDVFSYLIYSLDLTTFIKAFSRIEILSCCVSDNLLSSGTIFCSYCSIMIALNPKFEITFSSDHFIVSNLIIIKSFQVANIF
jgi:hypothetical protein